MTDNDAAPLGRLTVASLIGGVGDLRGKSLKTLTGRSLPNYPYEETPLVRRARAAWETPLEALSCEQLRLLVGQGFGLEWLAPIACELALLRPNAEITFYPGDLASAILHAFPDILAADPSAARAFATLDHAWIDDMRAWGEKHDECAELLEKARRLAAR